MSNLASIGAIPPRPRRLFFTDLFPRWLLWSVAAWVSLSSIIKPKSWILENYRFDALFYITVILFVEVLNRATFCLGRRNLLRAAKFRLLVGFILYNTALSVSLLFGADSGFVWEVSAYDTYKTTAIGILSGWAFVIYFGYPDVRLWLMMGDPRWEKRILQGDCGYCGYDLRGVRSEVCPECGKRTVVRINDNGWFWLQVL